MGVSLLYIFNRIIRAYTKIQKWDSDSELICEAHHGMHKTKRKSLLTNMNVQCPFFSSDSLLSIPITIRFVFSFPNK